VCGDMREIPYDNHFATVISLFNTFGYFASDEENERVVVSVYKALRSDGVFLLDYFNRDHIVNNLIPEDEQEISNMHVHSIRSLVEDERRIEKRMTIEREGEETIELLESVRLFSRDELVKIFTGSGFTSIECFGSLGGKIFNNTSERLIIIGKKR
jgi:SAM-dependent methyltransferase